MHYGLTQLINEPTHKNGHTLDHVYVNEFQMTLDYTVHSTTFGISTDHYPCIIKLPCDTQQETRETIIFRNLKNIDMVSFRNEIKNIVNDIVISDSDFVSNYNEFRSSSENLLNKHAPVITRNVCKRTKPKWVDEEYKTARAKRRKLEELWRRSKNEDDRKRYVD